MICSCHQFGGPRAIQKSTLFIVELIVESELPETMILSQPIGEPHQFGDTIYIYIIYHNIHTVDGCEILRHQTDG